MFKNGYWRLICSLRGVINTSEYKFPTFDTNFSAKSNLYLKMGNKLWVEISWYSSFKQKIFVRMYNRCVVIDQNLMYSKREKGQENSVYGYERSPCIAWSSRRLLRFLLIPWGLLYIQQRKRRVRKVWKVWRGYMYNKGQIPTLDRFPVLRRGWFEINKLMKLPTWKVNILP